MAFQWLASDCCDEIPYLHLPAEDEGAEDILVAHIAGEEDAERAYALLQSEDDARTLWIYHPNLSTADAVRWTRAGAANVASDIAELEQQIQEYLHVSGIGTARSNSPLIGESRGIRRIVGEIEMVAGRHCNVLLEGETGTGKEVVAKAIHQGGPRSRGPWVAVNCGAIPESLLEAELFGHVRGAFTGAVQSRAGKFEAAHHGTIFLDEIGEMPLAVQAKLLRVLQEREVERLGGNERIRLDVRVIAATNVNLAERVRRGLFRQDLYYRLNVFRMELPALRERGNDIVLLGKRFIAQSCAREQMAPKTLDPAAVNRLLSHQWPGNVRELENAIETAVICSGNRRQIYPSDLRLAYTPARPAASECGVTSLPMEGLDYQQALENFEKEILTQALTRTRGNKTAAADLLGLKRTTLSAKLRVLETRMPRLAA